ncbi:MAG: hypothetical protein ABIP53_09325 [Candidatus Limnocylindrales bacterium]
MSTFMLTDAAIERALAPDLDVAAPDDFTKQIAQAIALKPRQSRLWVLIPAAWPRHMTLAARMMLLMLLLIVLLVGAVAVASLQHRAAANGHVIVARATEIVDVDPETGVSSILVTNRGYLFGVARSGDGSLISYWTSTIDGTTLEIVSENGDAVRQVATNVIPKPVGQGQIDVWSPNGRSLAAGVKVGGQARILLVDISSGDGELIGPVGAENPLWSPDGQWLAFSHIRDGRSVLSVMHADGTGPRDISGDLGDLDGSGTNNWSPDGAWIYFGAERDGFEESHIYRARFDANQAEQLTFDQTSAGPALSPDGTLVVYNRWGGEFGTNGLWIMDADGGNQHLLLADGNDDGWSNDGQFVLSEWRPPKGPYELVTIRPDGSDKQTLMTFPERCVSLCAHDLAWGQPRP